MQRYDVIIKSAPAPAAMFLRPIRCAQLALKNRPASRAPNTLGRHPCLKRGLHPVQSAVARVPPAARGRAINFARWALAGATPKVDWEAVMLAYKRRNVIGQNTKGNRVPFQKNKVRLLKGWGKQSPRLASAARSPGARQAARAKHIIIAERSEPASTPVRRSR